MPGGPSCHLHKHGDRCLPVPPEPAASPFLASVPSWGINQIYFPGVSPHVVLPAALGQSSSESPIQDSARQSGVVMLSKDLQTDSWGAPKGVDGWGRSRAWGPGALPTPAVPSAQLFGPHAVF